MISDAEQAPVASLCKVLHSTFGLEQAKRIIDSFLDEDLAVSECAALWYTDVWMRHKQVAPSGDWISWGFLTGRAFGKTVAVCRYIHEVVAREPISMLLLSQDEQSSINIQVQGLIATAPPWAKPQWSSSAMCLRWPNGANALVRTPEVPGKIRGPEYQLVWASEIQSWPKARMMEAWSNILLSTRTGKARLIWDATPKRRHEILRELLADASADPEKHAIVRGTTHENYLNLAEHYIPELEKKYGGTLKGREELLGEMLPESENALVHQDWIDRNRREALAKYDRKIIAIDPAVSDRKGSDTTGFSEVALGADGQVYVLADRSGKYQPGVWADMALDTYTRNGCSLIVAETNKGGALVVQNLRAAAKERKLTITVLGKDDRPRQSLAGTVYVREVFARGAKEDRAEPVATAYEKGRVSHVKGADLASLEDTLTTWEPDATAKRYDSPGDLDALVHAVSELLGFNVNRPDAKAGIAGLRDAVKTLSAPQPPRSVSHGMFNVPGSSGGAGRI